MRKAQISSIKKSDKISFKLLNLRMVLHNLLYWPVIIQSFVLNKYFIAGVHYKFYQDFMKKSVNYIK